MGIYVIQFVLTSNSYAGNTWRGKNIMSKNWKPFLVSDLVDFTFENVLRVGLAWPWRKLIEGFWCVQGLYHNVWMELLFFGAWVALCTNKCQTRVYVILTLLCVLCRRLRVSGYHFWPLRHVRHGSNHSSRNLVEDSRIYPAERPPKSLLREQCISWSGTQREVQGYQFSHILVSSGYQATQASQVRISFQFPGVCNSQFWFVPL